MKTYELIQLLEKYPISSEVSVTFFNGEGHEVGDVEFVTDNGGPSIYVVGWNEKRDNDNENNT